MAKKNSSSQNNGSSFQNTSSVDTRVFLKGMVKDMNASYQAKESWSHARNAANNSVDGDLGLIGNEPANLACAKVPYTIIGAIHTYSDQWVLYSTDDVNSEIGLFDDSKCEYITLVNDPCLNFNKKHLIVGAAKENFDCTWQTYWDDGNNPSRTLNINDIPWKQVCTDENNVVLPGPPNYNSVGCITCVDTTDLDCEKIRIAPLVDTPCITLNKGESGGQLRNGSYQVFIAYTVNEQKVTDYIGVSNIQPLFDHNDLSGSLKITVSNLDKEFEYYELVIFSNNQNQSVAKRIGLYSTEQTDIEIDYIDQSLITVPLQLIPLRSPAYEKSDSMYVVNDYLIRQGPTEQFDFNYQSLANKIRAKWLVAEYPAAYYYKGGNKTSFMRDEQYSFFIRWIYNTGERSSSYHIPGRAPKINGRNQFGKIVDETAVNIGTDSLANDEMNFQIYNTATETATGLVKPTGDGGIIIAKGDMAYWQSSEKYPATRPDIWGDLCGKYIRHHKMPTEEISANLQISTTNGTTIRLLGVEFENIAPPLDNNGDLITNIVGYEILRGSREGNKSILAKGIFRNMRTYNIPDGGQTLGNTTGLYPNYPYNDLRPDVYFHDGNADPDTHRTDGCDTFFESVRDYKPLTGYKKDYFTFHSPELMFRRPFLSAYETRIYGELDGQSVGHFIKSENHPQNKLLRNSAAVLGGAIGIGYAINQVQGTRQFNYNGPKLAATLPPAAFLGSSNSAGVLDPGWAAALSALQLAGVASTVVDTVMDVLLSEAADIASIVDGGTFAFASTQVKSAADFALGGLPGMIGGSKDEIYTFDNPTSNLPKIFKLILGVAIGAVNIGIGAQEIIDLIYNQADEDDFAFKYNSHGFYDQFTPRGINKRFRTKNKNSNFIKNTFQEFEGYKINNLFRPMTVAIATEQTLEDPTIVDKSRYTIGGDADNDFGNTYLRNPDQEQTKNISVIYGALKYNFKNQYGQLDGIKQIQMRGCVELIDVKRKQDKFVSSPIFSGDVYINRYTEKTIMPIFADFLNGQPNQYVYDYLSRVNIPYPRFWMDTRTFDATALGREITTLGFASTSDPLPNDLFYLDRGNTSCNHKLLGNILPNIGDKTDLNKIFSMTTAYMYTHVNGVQDFFVESEYNLAHRDWKDEPKGRHYDAYEYTNVDDLFHADIIKEGNLYNYDLSLSITKTISQVTSFGNVQPRDYDPLVAENCYQYYPKRLIYSLQAQKEAKKDFWKVFLADNYKDFKNKVNVIKPINKSGAIIFFPYQSPQMFQGVDQLETDLGTKITLGDGGLFSQAFQNVANSDLSNEYGSSESARSVVNTPAGIFYLSQAQGKVFNMSNQLDNIANAGMKWWFNKYLPSTLIRQYPDLEFSKLSDNPVIGIGCQTIYDSNDDIVYFMKKDFSVKEEFKTNINFEDDQFVLRRTVNSRPIPLVIGDSNYFDSTSWTVSYDPKAKAWISFHDWFPELSLPSINHFLTTNTVTTDIPYCPPGYTFNPETKQCENIKREIIPAKTTVHEILSSINGDCILDIVIAMDDSASVNSNNILQAQRDFVQEFLTSSVIANGMSAGDIQVGFTRFNSQTTTTMNPNGYSMSNTVTPAQVALYYTPAGSFFTEICDGMTQADIVIQNRAGSQLGNRTGDPNFKSILVVIINGDTTECQGIPSGSNPSFPTFGCNQILGQPNYEIYGVFCSPTTPTLNAGALSIMNAITCSTPERQLIIVADNSYPLNRPEFVAKEFSEIICPGDCNCPEGYVLVYKNQNGYYTDSYGLCDPNNPPICRKVECECVGNCTPIETSGGCAGYTVYDIGNPTYINPQPLLCNCSTGKTTPPSYELSGLWRHNYRCDLYSNYYDVDYPWEVEIIENTGQEVTTLRSVEYQLESYVYKGDLHHGCADDRWHDLDFNFDESIIHNSEQVSGLLRLELNPKEDPYGMLQYPIIGAADMRILYSKEEQKYRFNQFWDATEDRGEFSAAERSIFITQLNGYIRDLNAANLNYNKDPFQHKKFRHYYNKVLLRRHKSGNRKMLLKLVNTKLNLSFR